MYIRPATLHDYEAVMALDPDNRILGGNDYMPHWYKRFVLDPNKDVKVVILDGKVVSI